MLDTVPVPLKRVPVTVTSCRSIDVMLIRDVPGGGSGRAREVHGLLADAVAAKIAIIGKRCRRESISVLMGVGMYVYCTAKLRS